MTGPGYQGKANHVTDWFLVKENVPHPDHDGVVGDLMQQRTTGRYQVWEYVPAMDNYQRHTVPHAWAKKQHGTSLA